MVTGVIGPARELSDGARENAELRRRDAILEAVGFIAERFLRDEDWEESIQDALARLGRAAGVSRVYIFENRPGPDAAILTGQRYEWVAPGIAPQIDNPDLQDFPLRAAGFGRWEEVLGRGDLICGHIRDFPPSEREVLMAQDIKSIAVVPIFVEQKWWGFIGFDACSAEREWSAAETDALRIVAGILGAAIQHQRVQAALREALAELQRSNADLEQFAHVASHDLQEPLRMVIGFLDLLAERYGGQLGPDADEFIGFAVDGARRMQNLINALLEYSRISTRGQAPRPTDANVALQDALWNLQVAIAEAGATVTHDPLPTVLADPTQLMQLFQNLIGNAIKFRRAEPPVVHISAQQTTDIAAGKAMWEFLVRDNGIGIAAEDADRIFNLFERLHTQRQYPGVGIGLAVCKKIVERHGGRIWVESTPGQGSTFHFTLPAA